MLLYHTTTAEKADSIMAQGFRDHATVNRRLARTYHYQPGVWFGDIPALDDELFDGIGLFDFDAERQAFIAVDVKLPHADIVADDNDSTWPGTQYWARAAVWNQFPRTRIALDDIVRSRVASANARLIELIKECLDQRDYSIAFANRVRAALADR